jgi:hypothetical protein
MHEVRNDVAHGRIKAKRASTAGGQLGASDGVSACKESHVVTKPDKFFGQVENDPLSAAIKPRRNAFNEGATCAIFMMIFASRPIQTRAVQQSSAPAQ